MTSSRLPSVRRAWRTALLLALTCAVSGCVSDGQGLTASAPGGATVAFESIDGPPPQIFDRMVDLLDSEAKLRNVAVVSREAPAAYRVRSYLAAQTVRGRTSIDWVWDVYDRNQQRTLRLSGTEPVGQAGHYAWAAADDVTLRRIAQAGLSGLSAVAGGVAPPAEAPAAPSSPPANGPAVASAGSPAPTSPQPGQATLSFASR